MLVGCFQLPAVGGDKGEGNPHSILKYQRRGNMQGIKRSDRRACDDLLSLCKHIIGKPDDFNMGKVCHEFY